MTDKIKFCPQCNSCLFDDMTSCCVCGYQYPCIEQDKVPLSAYDEIGELDFADSENSLQDNQKNCVSNNHKLAGGAVSMSVDCGGCVIDITVTPK